MNAAGGKARKLAVGEVIKPLKLQKSKGEIVPDPHVWESVENVISMIKAIKEVLIELSPEDKDKFTQKAGELTEELQQLNNWIKQQI
jgi:manganese/iron transport system substrate-binding protein